MKKTLILLALLMLGGQLCSCGGDHGSGTATTTEDGSPPPPSVSSTAVLTELAIDGGYSLDFAPTVLDYEVAIPAGRPAIPEVSYQAPENATVSVSKAVIPDSKTQGKTLITVTVGEETNTYSVTFTKNKDKGYHLQYQDVILFTPDYTLAEGEAFSFASSDIDTLAVDQNGEITAIGLSDTATVITASVGGKEVDRLVVDKVVKAPINIFLIMGQSNAYGTIEPPSGATKPLYIAQQKMLVDKATKGKVWCDSMETNYDDTSFSGMFDTSRFAGTSGFYAPLGKELYELTGEKTLLLKTAVGSSPIEAWTPDPELQYLGMDLYGETIERFRYYKDLFSQSDSKYVLNRVYAYWLQGETCMQLVYVPGEHTWPNKNGISNYKYKGDWNWGTTAAMNKGKLMTAETYYNYFIDMYEGLVKDVGLEFMGILPVRAQEKVSSEENRKEEQLIDLVAPRAAQYALNYTENGNIAFVTLKTEIGRTEDYADRKAEGWGYLSPTNVHYNQIGYNALGKDSARNTYYMMYPKADNAATEIKILDSNGRDVIEEGSVLEIKRGSARQITAIVLPLFADDAVLSFAGSDSSVFTIDAYGKITVSTDSAAVGKTATLTVSNGTLTKTLIVKIV